jgi:colicin import membrane protein
MVLMPDFNTRPRFEQRSIHVSLVSSPGPPQAAGSAISAPPPAAGKTVIVAKKKIKPAAKAPVIDTPPPEPLPAPPKPAKTVSLAPKQPNKPKVKRSLKKKTQNRQKMINQALTGVQKNLEKSQADSVRKALDQLKKKVAQTEADGSRTGQAAAATSGAAAGIPGATGSAGQRALEIADIYKIEVALQVERHWAYNPQVAGDDRLLQTKVVFKVMANGELTDIQFTKKSGNSYLDESVYRAIVKASPVSPHPAGINLPYVTVGVRFTPEGLK